MRQSVSAIRASANNEAKHDRKIVNTLAELYPEPKSELDFKDEYQLVVAVLLSAQCTDKKVNQVTPELFACYPDFSALSGAALRDLQRIIRPINYYKTKCKHLRELGAQVLADFSGSLPRGMDQLMTLSGVGRKTASVVLGELKAEHTLPVDTHVFRVSKRLALADGKTVRVVEDQLRARFESHQWRNLHHWLILHGRRVCKAQRPLCGACALRPYCPYGQANFTK